MYEVKSQEIAANGGGAIHATIESKSPEVVTQYATVNKSTVKAIKSVTSVYSTVSGTHL